MPSKATIPRVCEHCSAPFLTRLDRIKAGGGRFCSKACFGAACDKRIPRSCAHCGAVFLDKPSARDKFCSRTCSDQGKNRKPITYHDRICEHCGAAFERRSKGRKAAAIRFCSRRCFDQHKRVDPVAMYHRRVIKRDGCWGWRGKTDRRGYPFFELKRGGSIVMYRAHRLSYEIHTGPIPDGLNILHHCDNPPCTRPDHLFVGTHQDNTNDMLSKGRESRGENRPLAKLTTDQVANILSRLAVQPRPRGVLTAIARAFNVSVSTICDIDQGVSWKHISRNHVGPN
jgi:hypothetical protein